LFQENKKLFILSSYLETKKQKLHFQKISNLSNEMSQLYKWERKEEETMRMIGKVRNDDDR